MLKIIHTAISPTSAKNFVAPLAYADQMAIGADVEIWVDDNNDLNYNFKNGEYVKVNNQKCRLSLNLFHNFFRLISLIIALKRKKPNILIAHFSRGAFLPLLAGWLLGVDNRIYFNHGLPYLGYHGAIRFSLKILDYFNCVLAHKIITVNKSMAQFINNEINTSKKVHVLGAGSACGIAPDYFQQFSKSQKNTYREKFGLEKNSIIILYVGRPVKRKGYLVAYDVYCKLREISPQLNITLLMAGISSKDLLSQRKLIIDGVLALGFRDDMKQLYGIADVVFLPSFHEGLPYCLLEGGAQKCALVASKLPGLDELIIDGKTGYLIDPNNLHSTTQTLYKMASFPTKIQQMANNSFEIVKNFNRNEIVKEYKKIISNAGCL